MPDEVKLTPIFTACRLAFVPGRALYPKTIAELARLVEKYGGEVLEPEHDGSLPLARATHVVANSIDFEQYSAALARMLPVVRSEWIMHSLNRDKLSQVRPFSPDPRMIFASVTLTCADIPPSDKEVITGAILALGGTESKNLTRLTTHICALSLDHPKCQEALAKKLKCSIVLPHWFDDCFKLGRKIDEGPYLLPDPAILREVSTTTTTTAQGRSVSPASAIGSATAMGSTALDSTAATAATADRIPIPETTDLDGAVATFPETLPALDPAGRARLTVFWNKQVLLSPDLHLNARFQRIVHDMIRRGGGRVLEVEDDAEEEEEEDTPDAAIAAVDACDMFICHYRDGPLYVRAAQAGKDVGNLAWLFHIITNNEWCSPLRRLLHYPVPRHGVPGFAGLVIALSNYGGDARIYLENLITAAGATYTKSMRMENTHLITARDSGDKCEAAREWHIQTVNHLWIEESYAQGRLQSVTNPRYTTFPARTNLGEVIGQTFFDEGRLRAEYYPGGGGKGGSKVSTGKASTGKASTGKASNKGPSQSQSVLSDLAPNIAAPDDEETASEAEDAGVDNADADAGTEDDAGADANAQITAEASAAPDTCTLPQRPPRTRPVSTPLRRRGGQADKENLGTTTPLLSSGSRSAKDKARSTLQGLATDMALYEKEKKRSARAGPWGGKRAADEVDKAREAERQQAEAEAKAKAKAKAKKRLSEGTDEEGGDGGGGEAAAGPPSKKKKTLPPLQMRIVLTGYDRWVNNTAREEADRKKLRQLGIQIVQDTQACDFLAAPGLVRTMKFLKTLARGPGVLNAQYVTDVLAKGVLLPTEDYELKDPAGEARFGVSLPRVLARARAHRGRLLWNVVVYCMADIKNGAESYRAIAEANGAIFKLYRASSGTTIRAVEGGNDGNDKDAQNAPEPVYLLTSATAAERALWPRFAQMARAGGMEARIVAPDWLLDVAMRQEVVFEERYLAEEFAAAVEK